MPILLKNTKADLLAHFSGFEVAGPVEPGVRAHCATVPQMSFLTPDLLVLRVNGESVTATCN